MSDKERKLLEALGWEVECESPLEIRHERGAFATELAAQIVLEYYKELVGME